jgi:uncharacterized RDD family membrane protein YckC
MFPGHGFDSHGRIISDLEGGFQPGYCAHRQARYAPSMPLPSPTPHPQSRCLKPHIVRRYAAYAFDWTLVSLAVALIPIENVFLGFLIFILVGASYFSAMEASSYQGTLGKSFVGMRVEDDRGLRLSLPHAILRFFSGTASWATLNIGHLMASWRTDGRALHDLLAKTRVCQDRGLSARHDIAVVAFLVIHLVSLVVSVFFAVQKTMAALNASGTLHGVVY